MKLHRLFSRLVAPLALLFAAFAGLNTAFGLETATGTILCLGLLAHGYAQNFSVFGASVPRLDQFIGLNEQNQDLWYGTDYLAIDIPPTALLTAGSAADLVTVQLPPNLGRFIVLGYTLEATVAAGSLAAATVAVRTATGGLGVVVVTATALTAVTAVDLAITTNMGLTGAIVNAATVTALTVRQTVDSANAGTVAGRILVQPVR